MGVVSGQTNVFMSTLNAGVKSLIHCSLEKREKLFSQIVGTMDLENLLLGQWRNSCPSLGRVSSGSPFQLKSQKKFNCADQNEISLECCPHVLYTRQSAMWNWKETHHLKRGFWEHICWFVNSPTPSRFPQRPFEVLEMCHPLQSSTFQCSVISPRNIFLQPNFCSGLQNFM